MKGVLKKICGAVLSLLLVAGTLYAEAKLNPVRAEIIPVQLLHGDSKGSLEETENGYRLAAGPDAATAVLLYGATVLRLAPGTVADMQLPPNGGFSDTIRLDLKAGRIWINSRNAPTRFEVGTAHTTLRADPGIFDISYNAGNMHVTAFRRSLEVLFKAAAINSKLVVPEGRSLLISEAKITGNAAILGRLRYSKLQKEFPVLTEDTADEWIEMNEQNDRVFQENYRKQFAERVRNEGPKVSFDDDSFFSAIGGAWGAVNRGLTIEGTKRATKEIASLFDYFDSAVYATLIGDTARAASFADSFRIQSRRLAANQTPEAKAAFLDAVLKRTALLAFASPADDLFELKAIARDLLPMTPLERIHENLNDILDTTAREFGKETEQRAVTLLRRFAGTAKNELERVTNPADRSGIFLERVRLVDFLVRHPILMREEFLKIVELFEKTELALIQGQEENDDEREFLVSQKLNHIKIVRELMEKGDMPFQDARRSLLSLANQIEILKPTISSTAVASYFDAQLAELAPLLAFLRAQSSESLRGSFDERFADFRARAAEFEQVNELLNTARGGEDISVSRREELAQSVASDLGPTELKNVKIVLPESEGVSLVKVIEAAFEGKPFTALYDIERKVFSDIVFDGEAVPNAIRLENLRKFFLLKLGKLAGAEEVTPESLTEEIAPGRALPLVQKVARDALFEALEKMSISVAEKDMGFEDFDRGVMHVHLALLGEGSAAKAFSFDVDTKGTTVSQLRVKTVLGEITANDSFALKDLASRITQIYERAVFEEERSRELERFAEEGVIPDLPEEE